MHGPKNKVIFIAFQWQDGCINAPLYYVRRTFSAML